MIGYIYKIVNTINGKMYIGKTTRTIAERYAGHLRAAKDETSKRHKTLRLYLAMRKYGIDKFIVEEVDTADSIEELDAKEQYWIKELHTFIDDPLCHGYNMTIGGDGGHWSSESAKKWYATKLANNSFKHSELTKQKIAASNKGKSKSELHKKHLSENHHLRQTHILFFKDGHTELTTDSVKQIASTINISEIKLKRASEVGSFRCGEFFLLDMTDLDTMFINQFSKHDNIFIDPVVKDEVSFYLLRGRYQAAPERYDNSFPQLTNILKPVLLTQLESFLEKYNSIKNSTVNKKSD